MDNNLPFHIAIIPDGNRRWAREKGLEAWEGHREGAENIEKIVRKAFALDIKCISFWGSSLENLQKRPLREKQELLKVYEEYFKRLISNEDVFKNEAKINVIGKWEKQFPNSLVNIIKEGIEKTKKHNKYSLNFFLAYSGDDEMIEAIKSIAEEGISPEEINAETIKAHLMTKDLPPVDYLIRTGGEPHLSAGFMMWDVANSQLYFSEKYFPDFAENEFEEAVNEYKERGRRKGK
ncbi:MAG: hypothetical protein ACD_11C00027G0003 [uncultured bacterium]|nr:MAG: hypothetical protein ACD_11C00027G0003 [uncultured bacterium]HBR72065.1 di-trans,poly-cis-decaprenylcistransferase [Candidatus Moranbacteria bacterium]